MRRVRYVLNERWDQTLVMHEAASDIVVVTSSIAQAKLR